MDYYAAYNFFRLAGILQGIVGRVRDGTAANANAAQNAACRTPAGGTRVVFRQARGARWLENRGLNPRLTGKRKRRCVFELTQALFNGTKLLTCI